METIGIAGGFLSICGTSAFRIPAPQVSDKTDLQPHSDEARMVLSVGTAWIEGTDYGIVTLRLPEPYLSACIL
jgi:hypothetical protein